MSKKPRRTEGSLLALFLTPVLRTKTPLTVFFPLFTVLCYLITVLSSCELFNGPKTDLMRKIEAEIAYANAPWVPLRIDTGGLGTASLMGSQSQTVKLGYSFSLVFQPHSDYEFRGWQAWYEGEEPFAYWLKPENPDEAAEAAGAERVKFVINNLAGTEAEIFVYEMPPSGQLIIGPWGADTVELRVRIEFPPEWGTADTLGELSGKRQGFPFTAEFVPFSEWSFEGWRAYAYHADWSPDMPGERLDTGSDPVVLITPLAGGKAEFTVYIGGQVILIPWCNNRPALIRSNPPLIPAISPFPYDQKITLWFNMGVDESTVLIGETIIISGVYTSGQNRGQPAGKNGDGDISEYFKVSAYDPDEWRIELAAKDDNEYPGEYLQLLNISVSVGPGVQNLNGLAMADVQTLSYLTDTGKAQKVYEAGSIRASRDGIGYFQDFGTSWQDPEIDRRFNEITNTVHITFTVTAPDGALQQVPNRFYIYERLYAYLDGFAITPALVNGPYKYTDAEVTLSNNIYSFSHELETGKTDLSKPSGILQLIVLPWNESDVEGEGYQPQDMEAAVAAGQYVTIVLDNEAPGIRDLDVSITGGAYDSNSGVYNFATNSNLTLTMNRLAMLADNGNQGGILSSEA